MEGGVVGHNFERDPARDHPCQVWHKRHVTKKKRKHKGQAQIDNPDTLATPGTKDT